MPEFDIEGITSVGFVDDLYSFLHAMDIAIVPIISGSGMKLKLFDYMTSGLPMVATEKAIEGINIKSGKHAIVVDEVDSQFLKGVRTLIDEPSTRTQLGTNARELVKTEYDWNIIGEKLVTTYESIG